MSKTTDHLKGTWEKRAEPKPDGVSTRAPRPAGKEFDPLQHGTHQESEHNKHNHPEAGPGKQ